MTYHDPIQGILTCQPKTVLRRTATSIRLQGGNPRRNDRLQGIFFKPASTAGVRSLPQVISPRHAVTPAAVDDLMLDEFDEVYLSNLLQTRATATVVKSDRRFLIHSVRLPLRREK